MSDHLLTKQLSNKFVYNFPFLKALPIKCTVRRNGFVFVSITRGFGKTEA